MPNLKDSFSKLDRKYFKNLSESEKKLMKLYLNSLKTVKEEISSLYSKYDYPNINVLRKFDRLNKIKGQIESEISGLTKEAIKVTSESIREGWKLGYYGTGEAFKEGTGYDFVFSKLPVDSINKELQDDMWVNLLKAHSADMINKVNIEFETMLRTNARYEVTEGLIQGMGYKEIAKKIEDRFGVGFNRSRTIAFTETHKAHSGGRLKGINKAIEAGERLGVTVKKVWRHNHIGTPRPEHLSMDGVYADENGMFYVMGESLEAPGLGELPENNINCHCSAEVEVEDFGDEKSNETKIEEKEDSIVMEARKLADDDFVNFSSLNRNDIKELRERINECIKNDEISKISKSDVGSVKNNFKSLMSDGLNQIHNELYTDMTAYFDDWYSGSNRDGASVIKKLMELNNETKTYFHSEFIDSIKELSDKFNALASKNLRNLWSTKDIKASYDIYKKGFAYVKRMNENLLEMLFGNNKIKLYRGVSSKYFNTLGIDPSTFGNEIEVLFNSTESWTLDKQVAKSFVNKGGAILEVEVESKDVLSTFFSTLGAPLHEEKEFILAVKNQTVKCKVLK